MSKIYNEIAKAIEEEENCMVGGNELYLEFVEEYVYVFSFEEGERYEIARFNKNNYCYLNANYIKAILDN